MSVAAYQLPANFHPAVLRIEVRGWSDGRWSPRRFHPSVTARLVQRAIYRISLG
jgi:hypothetical protein